MARQELATKAATAAAVAGQHIPQPYRVVLVVLAGLTVAAVVVAAVVAQRRHLSAV